MGNIKFHSFWLSVRGVGLWETLGSIQGPISWSVGNVTFHSFELSVSEELEWGTLGSILLDYLSRELESDSVILG